jgi:hypothetical protein
MTRRGKGRKRRKYEKRKRKWEKVTCLMRAGGEGLRWPLYNPN